MENLVVSTSKKITLDKFTSQVKIVTQGSVKKVLSITATSLGETADIGGGAVTLSGRIKVDVLYLNLDEKIEKASVESDFIEKQKVSFEMNNLFASDALSVSEVNFSSNEIICLVLHKTEIVGIFNYEVNNFDNEQNIVANSKELALTKFVCAATDDFSVAEENETNLTDVEIMKINPIVVIDDVLSSVDKIVVEGRVLAEVLYLDGDNLGQMFKQVDFKQEIQAENTTPTMKAFAYADVKSANITIDNSNEKAIMALNFELAIKAYIFEEHTYSIATDLFMLTNDVSVTYDFIDSKNYIEMVEQAESVLSQTDITQIEDFDDLIGVFEPQIEIVNIENQENNADVYAKINAYALYKSSDSIEKIDIFSEVKFEILKQGKTYVDDARLNCEIVSAKVKAGKEIEVVFKTNCHAEIAEQMSTMFVKSFETAAEKTSDESGIKVYIARQNQTVFDVAKALNVRPELILSQNEVEDVFETGQKVYVYSPINLV